MRTLALVAFLLVAFLLAAVAFAQRAAGTFQPALTKARALKFQDNPDGGAPCVAAVGVTVTDQGVREDVRASPLCPNTSAQATRVRACESMGESLVNRAGRVTDGGL